MSERAEVKSYPLMLSVNEMNRISEETMSAFAKGLNNIKGFLGVYPEFPFSYFLFISEKGRTEGQKLAKSYGIVTAKSHRIAYVPIEDLGKEKKDGK